MPGYKIPLNWSLRLKKGSQFTWGNKASWGRIGQNNRQQVKADKHFRYDVIDNGSNLCIFNILKKKRCYQMGEKRQYETIGLFDNQMKIKIHKSKKLLHFKVLHKYLQDIFYFASWLIKHKLFTIWPLTEKLCWPLPHPLRPQPCRDTCPGDPWSAWGKDAGSSPTGKTGTVKCVCWGDIKSLNKGGQGILTWTQTQAVQQKRGRFYVSINIARGTPQMTPEECWNPEDLPS